MKFGADCLPSIGSHTMPEAPPKWEVHFTYCYPDAVDVIRGGGRTDANYLHITCVYDEKQTIWKEDRIAVHYGYKPQDIKRGPHFWSSKGWDNENINDTMFAAYITYYIKTLFDYFKYKIII